MGIKRAIYAIQRDKDLKSRIKDIKKWKPNLIYLMINKNISEKIYEKDKSSGQYTLPKSPLIVQQGIVSETVWDSIWFIGGGTKAQDKWSSSKLTILQYPDKLLNEVANLYQLIHSLHYGFGFAVPFQMGPTSLPSPRYLKYI